MLNTGYVDFAPEGKKSRPGGVVILDTFETERHGGYFDCKMEGRKKFQGSMDSLVRLNASN